MSEFKAIKLEGSVLLKEEVYLNMVDEILSLRKSVKGLMETLAGNSKSYSSAEELVDDLFEKE